MSDETRKRIRREEIWFYVRKWLIRLLIVILVLSPFAYFCWPRSLDCTLILSAKVEHPENLPYAQLWYIAGVGADSLDDFYNDFEKATGMHFPEESKDPGRKYAVCYCCSLEKLTYRVCDVQKIIDFPWYPVKATVRAAENTFNIYVIDTDRNIDRGWYLYMDDTTILEK